MPLTEDAEQALAEDARKGSAQALATLLQANYTVVYRTMVKLTMDARAAEDATQEAMERAVRRIESFDPSRAKFSTWLVAIARNRWIDETRKGKWLRPARDHMPEGTEPAHDPYDELIESDDLLRALRGMDPKARTPVTMYHVLGYSYDEIAKAMRIPLGTVKSRISNGIRQLRMEMGNNGA